MSLIEEGNLTFCGFGESFALVSDVLELLQLVYDYIYKLFDSYPDNLVTAGELLNPPLVSVSDGCGRLGEGRVLLHRDKVGKGGKGGELLVICELNAVVVL